MANVHILYQSRSTAAGVIKMTVVEVEVLIQLLYSCKCMIVLALKCTQSVKVKVHLVLTSY